MIWALKFPGIQGLGLIGLALSSVRERASSVRMKVERG
jgi:hypothetical protein